jgi:Raf kinase inhibitor-like YbhB/YbcL family protein
MSKSRLPFIIFLAVILFIGLFLAVGRKPSVELKKGNMEIKSTAFQDGGQIPPIYTCSGKNISPELIFGNIPEGTKSLALIMDDPDASRGITFNHWLIWNVSPKEAGIAEDSVPSGAMQGKNDAGKIGYSGPCPPSGKPHHYRFKLFAISAILNIPNGSSLEQLEDAIDGHAIEQAQLVGIYERTQ